MWISNDFVPIFLCGCAVTRKHFFGVVLSGEKIKMKLWNQIPTLVQVIIYFVGVSSRRLQLGLGLNEEDFFKSELSCPGCNEKKTAPSSSTKVCNYF